MAYLQEETLSDLLDLNEGITESIMMISTLKDHEMDINEKIWGGVYHMLNIQKAAQEEISLRVYKHLHATVIDSGREA